MLAPSGSALAVADGACMDSWLFVAFFSLPPCVLLALAWACHLAGRKQHNVELNDWSSTLVRAAIYVSLGVIVLALILGPTYEPIRRLLPF
jgi:hypothetical protein